MEMLKSEVQLLLVRNQQLETENLLLKENTINLNERLITEKQLNVVLESIKSAQNEYINQLNALLVDLTHETGNQFSYNQIKRDLNRCVKVCKHLQTEYEISKTSANNRFEAISNETQRLFSSNNQSFDSNPDSIESHFDQTFNDSDCEDLPEAEVLLSVDNDEDEEDEEQEMPELDYIDLQNDDIQGHNTDVDDDDDDPNGAGEQYLDINDIEFIPKRTLPKSARKSFITQTNRLPMSPKRKKLDKRAFKTSQKFGDKFRCNWKGCVFISSYKQNVERHYRVHTGERPFKCQFKGCGFSASQAGNLKVHQQRHGHFTPNAVKIRVKSTHNAVKASPVPKTSK